MPSSYQSIVVLTGAGVSAESGLRTFRSSDGLWEEHRIEDVCTPEGFAANPELVHRFYNARREQLRSVEPNAAHKALADFQKRFKGSLTLVTQNVDNLHEQAGHADVVHMHGELLKARCTQTQQIFAWHDAMDVDTQCPCCNSPGTLRPHIVWFGEMPFFMDEIEQALYNCDLFVSIGTSGQVYPAAGFVQIANTYGAHSVELNLEPSNGQSLFAEHHYGAASVIVDDFFTKLG